MKILFYARSTFLGAAVMGLVSIGHADNGTWTNTAGGTWSDVDTGNWLNGIVADGSGFTADFSTLNITAATTVSLGGPRTIGTLIFGDTDTSSGASWTLNNGGNSANILTLAGATPTVTVNALGTSATATISSVIDGTSGLTKNGVGLLVLSGDNVYSGGTTISAGTLRIANSSSLGSGSVTIASGATLQIQTSMTLSGAGTISGSGILALTGTNGTVTISDDNSATYSGQVQVNRNTVAVGHDGALGTGSVRLGVNDQPSGIRSTSTATRTLSNAFVITGTVNSIYRFGSSSPSLNGNLHFTSVGNTGLGSIARRFEVFNTTQFDGAFTGTGGIQLQAGTSGAGGTLILAGANTYTGATNVNAGTMLVNGSLSASSAVSVASGATLGGNGTVGAVTLASGGNLAPGTSIGTFGVSSVNMQGGSFLNLELNTGAVTADLLNVSGAFDLALANDAVLQLSLLGTDVILVGQTFTLVDYGTWNGGLFTYQGNVLADDAIFTLGLNEYQISYNGVDGLTSAITLTTTAVPEPAGCAMLGLGLGALALVRRRTSRGTV